jgi:hypothetical protein
MTDHDERETLPCGRCEEPIPRDVERCPVCGYQPAGRSEVAIRLGEYAFAAVAVVSVLTFVGGVVGRAFGLSVGPLARLAIVTPYTTGVSAFFAYYLHRKRRATPTDDDTFG